MVVVGTGSIGSKFIRRDYPIEEGLEAGSTTQEGRETDLEEC